MRLAPKEHIHYILLHSFQDDLQTEYKFSKTRKFLFDWCIPAFKLAIEYEGIISAKARHTSTTGYSKDCQKYNLAAIEGWTVLRYTALNYKDLFEDIKAFLNNFSSINKK